MKIAVVGAGYVGLVLGTCLSNLGNDVVCVDINEKKVSKLKKGLIPIYEPGLKNLVLRNLKEGRLKFTTNIKKAIEDSLVIFIAVGTPPDKNNRADISAVENVAGLIGKYMNDYKVVVNKSTVPIGTAELVKGIITQNQTRNLDFDVVSNPEFMREGKAVKDFMAPARIVVGVESRKAEDIMKSLYSAFERPDRPILVTDIKTAEMIKYASNAFLATKISFINQLSHLAEKTGADIKRVSLGMGLDPRIGPRFLQAGVGYGGSCFPKDVKALIQTLKDNNCDAELLEAVEFVNEMQRKSIVEKAKMILGKIDNKVVSVWGLAFKPDTDDIREAPSVGIIKELQKENAKINAFDPIAMSRARKVFKNVRYCKTPYHAVKGADLLIILTEWDEFRELDKRKIKKLMRRPNVIDGRNIYEPKEMRGLGFNYVGVGR